VGVGRVRVGGEYVPPVRNTIPPMPDSINA